MKSSPKSAILAPILIFTWNFYASCLRATQGGVLAASLDINIFSTFWSKKAFVFSKNLPYVVPENKMVQEAFSWESYNEAEHNQFRTKGLIMCVANKHRGYGWPSSYKIPGNINQLYRNGTNLLHRTGAAPLWLWGDLMSIHTACSRPVKALHQSKR